MNFINEKGVMFPIAVMLLLIVTSALITYLYSFEAQLNSYSALESSYVRATITILKQLYNR